MVGSCFVKGGGKMFALPEYIIEIMGKIEKKSFEVFLVGGSVRDLLMDKEVNDYDLTTNARPEEIEEIFKDYKTIDVGKKYGTIVLIYRDEEIEITTYRTDSVYKDGRRPESVEFSEKLEEDLKRRDFTVNAIAYNPKQGIIDYHGGLDDIENKIIRAVGDPELRFAEDHLRIMRAIRFSGQLNFEIEAATYRACRDKRSKLDKISSERIRDEIFKIMLAERPSLAIRKMEELEILEIVLPELIASIGFDQKSPYHERDIYNHILCVVDETPRKLHLRLAGLFHDIAKPDCFSLDQEGVGHFYGHDKLSAELARKILKRWNSPKKMIDKVAILVENHMDQEIELTDRALRRLIYRVGEENILDLIDLQKADKACSYSGRKIGYLDKRKTRIIELLNEDIYEKDKLDINGYDIINLGYPQGRIIGEILDYLMGKLLENPEINKKEKLIELIREEFKI